MGFEILLSTNAIITPLGAIKLLDIDDTKDEDMWKCPDCGALYPIWFRTAMLIDQSKCVKCRMKKIREVNNGR